MKTIRLNLKTGVKPPLTFKDVLDFCEKTNIVGVGWPAVTTKSMDEGEIRNEIIANYNKESVPSALKAINGIRRLSSGDLVWTRIGGDASQYYLCKVSNQLWTDRKITEDHKLHDIGHFVSAKWLSVSTVDFVPGKVVNSFLTGSTVQQVNGVDIISRKIWNSLSLDTSDHYPEENLSVDHFWDLISSEDLECLVLLYLQKKGYFLISTTVKSSTAKFEGVLVHSDGTHRCFPQIKIGTSINQMDYVQVLEKNYADRVVLFTTSENYGEKEKSNPRISCLSKEEIMDFIRNNRNILPGSINHWLDLFEF